MIEQVFWQTRRPIHTLPALDDHVETEALVVGGGMAGLATAQALRQEHGRDVVLLEARYCGAGATGRSSGFITPDSELQLSQLARRFGPRDAGLLWRAALDAVNQIRDNIRRYAIECDLLPADSLYVATNPSAYRSVVKDHLAHARLGFESHLIDRNALPNLLGTETYFGGLLVEGMFGIDGCSYALGLRDALKAQGVRIFEQSPVVDITRRGVRTLGGSVRARWVFLCLDRYAPRLGIARPDVYHAQTFLALSVPLDASVLKQFFPERPMMVWDSDLIYQYFRCTAEGRLLVGGGALRKSYRPVEHGSRVPEQIVSRLRERFPALREVKFTHQWPGLIGVTKDLLPLAGPRPEVPTHYYALCGAGLPWSVVAGRIAARCAVEEQSELDRFLSPSRAFTPIEPLQGILGQPVTFALSNYHAKEHLRGHSPQVRKQQRWIRAALAGLSASALVAALARRFSKAHRSL